MPTGNDFPRHRTSTNCVKELKLDEYNEKLDEYNESLDPGEQVDTEEAIAAMVFSTDTDNEENCATLGRGILKLVLKRFRPDLFVN